MRKRGGRFGQPRQPLRQIVAHRMEPNSAHARSPEGLWWDLGKRKGAKKRKTLHWK